MNWKQYFELRQSRSKWFWRLLIILILFHIVVNGKDTYNGAAPICSDLCIGNSTTDSLFDYNRSDNISGGSTLNDSGSILLDSWNQTQNTTWLNLSQNSTNASYSLNQSWQEEFLPMLVNRYIWYNCSEFCDIYIDNYEIALDWYRFTKGPASLVVYILIALILSFIIFLYKNHKAENASSKGGDDDDSKNEKKEDKKK